MAENPFEDLRQEVAKEAQSGQPGDSLATNLGEAAVGGFKEAFGLEPSAEVTRFTAENPVLGTTAKIVGQVPLYTPALAPFRAFRAIPLLGRAASGAEQLAASRPILGQAAKEAVRVTPTEVGRLTGATAVGGDVSEVASEAGLELGISGAIGAGGRAIFEAVPGPQGQRGFLRRLQEINEDFDPQAPPQEQLQAINKLARPLAKPDEEKQLENLTANLRAGISSEDLPKTIVSPLEGQKPKAQAKALDRLFRGGKNIQSRKLRVTVEDGLERADLDKIKQQLPTDSEQFMRFPRVLKPSKDKVGDVQSRIRESMQKVDDDLFLAKERQGGFVMAKQTDDSEFLIFKTDQPGQFRPSAAQFGNAQSRQVFKLREAADRQTRQLEQRISGAREIRRMVDTASEMDFTQTQPVDRISRQFFQKNLAGSLQDIPETLENTYDFARRFQKEYLSPANTQFAGRQGNPLAAYLSQSFRVAQDSAQARVAQRWFGQLDDKLQSSLFRFIFNPQVKSRGLNQVIEDAAEQLGSRQELARELSEIHVKRLTPEQVSQGSYSQAAKDVAETLGREDTRLSNELQALARLTEDFDFDPKPGHLMISRTWIGNNRQPIWDSQSGNLVAVASGKTQRQLRGETERLKSVMQDEGFDPVAPSTGPKANLDDDELFEELIKLPEEQLSRIYQRAAEPSRFQQERGVQGFIENFELDDLKESIRGTIEQSERFKTGKLLENKFGPLLDQLRQQDPQVHKQLTQRMADFVGRKGPFTAKLEQYADDVLTPTLGLKATDIQKATNQSMFHLTLGFMDLGFAALNAVTPIQTALPEAAFAMRAPLRDVQQYYSPVLIAEGTGRLREMRFLDPLRMMKVGIQDMVNPDDELRRMFTRAQEHGSVTPVLAEEVFGSTSNIANHLQNVAKGERGILNFIGELSGFLPSKTEELARGLSFTMGRRIGRDFFGYEGEDLQLFAEKFVQNSMFRYKTEDRPRIITGAFGATAGLFKNWMMHYVANTAKYAGQGWYQKNWSPLLWQQLGTFSIAGGGGMMGYGIIDNFSELVSDQGAMENLYSLFGYKDEIEEYTGEGVPTYGADFAFYGLPAFLGLSLQSRAAVPGADVPRDLEHLFSVAMWDRAKALGNALGQSFDEIAVGQHPAENKRVRDLFIQAAAPRTMQSVLQQVGNKGMRSLKTGNLLVSEMTWDESLASTVGLNTTRIARSYEAMSEVWQEQRQHQELVSFWGEKLAQAREEGSRETHNVIIQATEAGLSYDSIARSADARQSKRREGVVQRQADPLQRRRLERLLEL